MTMDISNKTVALLMIVAIALSVTGTWVALTSTPSIEIEPSSGSEGGRLSFTVDGDTQPILAPSSEEGNVGVIII